MRRAAVLLLVTFLVAGCGIPHDAEKTWQRIYYGEVFVVVSETSNLVQNLSDAGWQCTALNWRLHDVVIMPVPSLDE